MKKFNIKVDGVMHEVEVEELGGSMVSAAPVTQVAPKAAPAPAAPFPPAQENSTDDLPF